MKVVNVEVLPQNLFSELRDECLCCGVTKCSKVCSRCKSAKFCSVSCQTAVWKSHKEICGLVARCLVMEQNTLYDQVSDMMA